MTTPVKSLIPLKDSTREQEITYKGKYTGILDQEEQVSPTSHELSLTVIAHPLTT